MSSVNSTMTECVCLQLHMYSVRVDITLIILLCAIFDSDGVRFGKLKWWLHFYAPFRIIILCHYS
uniref:Uncharacterized protein n=1 Tax=Anguilla anguilla TaxID=7936 RepID=A0A0E9W3Y2_ANGAN